MQRLEAYDIKVEPSAGGLADPATRQHEALLAAMKLDANGWSGTPHLPRPLVKKRVIRLPALPADAECAHDELVGDALDQGAGIQPVDRVGGGLRAGDKAVTRDICAARLPPPPLQ